MFHFHAYMIVCAKLVFKYDFISARLRAMVTNFVLPMYERFVCMLLDCRIVFMHANWIIRVNHIRWRERARAHKQATSETWLKGRWTLCAFEAKKFFFFHICFIKCLFFCRFVLFLFGWKCDEIQIWCRDCLFIFFYCKMAKKLPFYCRIKTNEWQRMQPTSIFCFDDFHQEYFYCYYSLISDLKPAPALFGKPNPLANWTSLAV